MFKEIIDIVYISVNMEANEELTLLSIILHQV